MDMLMKSLVEFCAKDAFYLILYITSKLMAVLEIDGSAKKKYYTIVKIFPTKSQNPKCAV